MMESIAADEVWRSVPPEEKFEAMAQAHASGVGACTILILICCTIAVGLKLKWLMWTSFCAAPFVFQFAAGKRWRDIKPRIMLEYLAARSAARRLAFAARGKDLTCKFLFRGKLEQVFDDSTMQEAMEAMLANSKDAAVWVALFGDSVVMLEEQYGGAEAKIAHIFDERLTLEARDLDGRGEYSSNKELIFTIQGRNKTFETFRLTSRYPAALVVFEKKIRQNMEGTPKTKALTVNDEFDDSSKPSGVMIFD